MVTSVATVSYKVTKQIHTSQVCLEINQKKKKQVHIPPLLSEKRTES